MFLILRKFMELFNNNHHKENIHKSSYRKKQFVNKINMNHPTQKNNTKLKKYEN